MPWRRHCSSYAIRGLVRRCVLTRRQLISAVLTRLPKVQVLLPSRANTKHRLLVCLAWPVANEVVYRPAGSRTGRPCRHDACLATGLEGCKRCLDNARASDVGGAHITRRYNRCAARGLWPDCSACHARAHRRCECASGAAPLRAMGGMHAKSALDGGELWHW